MAQNFIKVSQRGDLSKTFSFLNRAKNISKLNVFDKYGKLGVNALSSATPQDTGLTASSWYYRVERTKTSVTISFCNSNINKGVPIAIILQYGHGTRNGGWVEGIDYINPAVQPVFIKLADELWREVTK